MNRTSYNNLYNEGGEGYIPSKYQPKEAQEPRIWQLRGKRDSILHKMESVSTSDPRYDEYQQRLTELAAEIVAEEAKGETD